MTTRLATMCFVTALLIGVCYRSLQAQDKNDRGAMKGISAVAVLVEDLSDGGKVLGLTTEMIQTDVELKLRLAGILIVPPADIHKIPGAPVLYVRVDLMKEGTAEHIELQFLQKVSLLRNGDPAIGSTWWTGNLSTGLSGPELRGRIKDHVDEFLNAWLSVNPKK